MKQGTERLTAARAGSPCLAHQWLERPVELGQTGAGGAAPPVPWVQGSILLLLSWEDAQLQGFSPVPASLSPWLSTEARRTCWGAASTPSTQGRNPSWRALVETSALASVDALEKGAEQTHGNWQRAQ